MPFAAHSRPRYSPSAPSFARCTCAWLVNAKGSPWISATGTLRPRMPHIRVRNWSSPACSISSAAGSEPGMLLFCGWTVTASRPSVSFPTCSHRSTRNCCWWLCAGWLWNCFACRCGERSRPDGTAHAVATPAAAPASRSSRRLLPCSSIGISPKRTDIYEPFPGLACDAATPRPADRLAPGQLAHRGDQVLELERLLERLRGADLARDLEHVVIPQRLEAGHGDDLHLGKFLAQFVDRLDAFLFRHEDIGDDHVGRPGALLRQPLNAVGGAFGFDAVALKPLQRKLPEVVVVVDDENARHVPGKGRRNADSMQTAPNNP